MNSVQQCVSINPKKTEWFVWFKTHRYKVNSFWEFSFNGKLLSKYFPSAHSYFFIQIYVSRTYSQKKKNYFKVFQQIKHNYKYKWNITVSCKMLGWMKHKHQDCWEKYQEPQICRWHHNYGRKWRGTKEPLDERERKVKKLA